ncbi:MAG: hypothetical protein KGO81_04880 [Bacteroidota bacterium]|nr:hypothetical protein [Bacteroidota bacterium]
MNELNDKHIEQLLKEAAGKYEPDLPEEAWSKMNVLLDAHFSKKKRRFIFWWWLLPGLLIATAGIYYGSTFFHKSIYNAIAKEQSSNTKRDNKGMKLIPLREHADSVEKATNKQMSSAMMQDTTSAMVFSELKGARKSISLQNRPVYVHVTSGGMVKPAASLNELHNHKAIAHSTEQHPVNEKKSFASSAVKTVTEDAGNTNDKNAEEKQALLTPGSNIIKKDSIPVSLKQGDTLQQPAPKKHANKSNKELSRWSIAATGALDASFIHLSSIEKLAVQYGVGAIYRINQKLSIGTGFYAGKKVYSARKEDYRFDKSVTPSYYNYIQAINADCYVYDIPVYVRYNVRSAAKYTIYNTVGFSSYIMKRETYNVLADYGSTSAYHEWYYSNRNAHLFSGLKLSVGYESALSKTLFLSVEPYWNVSLRGVGEGAVRLSSFGLQTNLRYNFLKKKRK